MTKRSAILASVCLAVVGIFAFTAVWTTRPAPDLGKIPAVLSLPGILPNPYLTPGATNPDITQDTINKTICNPKWTTKSIRPPSSYTTALKKKQLAAGYTVNGDTNPADFEEDHLVSLELGGNPTDSHNLWPESYNTTPNARDKDKVENYLHAQVCAGDISLSDAQREISTNWLAVYDKIK